MKVRIKPVEVEAVQWKGNNINEILKFTGNTQENIDIECSFFTISTLEGKMAAEIGDWIIKGVAGELYPCKPDIFYKTYEIIEGDE